MTQISKLATRDIIEDFALELENARVISGKPTKYVINFRTEIKDSYERDIYRVPISLLRYRKDNGRIASDVMDHENNFGPLIETDDGDQKQIKKFLEKKDPEKTATLRKLIIHSSQQQPAIITCDGFLIDGNRRKTVLESLSEEFPHDESYSFMKVVFLPGPKDAGGPPTLIEIEKLENRYQLQSDGKSDYYGFDSALSIKRKIGMGLSLLDQVADDPQYAGLSKTELTKATKKLEKDLLSPLECVDRYLAQFNRRGQYKTISTGSSDREGRWQAFIDYSNTYNRVFCSPNQRNKFNIEEDQIGELEETAFNLIRLRNLQGLPKVHAIMRSLPKYCEESAGKSELLKIAAEVEPLLSLEESTDGKGNPLPLSDIDAKWVSKNKQPIIHRLKKAKDIYESKKERETPITLLEAALAKLTHDAMDLKAIAIGDYDKALKLASKIKRTADGLESDIYHMQKDLKKLSNQRR